MLGPAAAHKFACKQNDHHYVIRWTHVKCECLRAEWKQLDI